VVHGKHLPWAPLGPDWILTGRHGEICSLMQKQWKLLTIRSEMTPKEKNRHFNTTTPWQHKINQAPKGLTSKSFFSHESHEEKWLTERKNENPIFKKQNRSKLKHSRSELSKHR